MRVRTMLGLFIVAHGLVTAGIWGVGMPAAPEGEVQPPDPAHTWLIGDTRAISAVLGVAVGCTKVVAGVGYLAQAGWWPPMAIGTGAASLALFGLYFTPWWSAGIVISAVLIVGAMRAAVA
jgi:hypothetical protein